MADEPDTKDFQGPITIEKSFEVDGRKLTCKVTFPGPVVEEAGMENLVLASNRALWELETNSHEISEL